MAGRPAKKPAPADSLFADTPDLPQVPTGEEPPPSAPPPEHFPQPWVKLLGAEFGKPYFAKLQEFVATEREEHEVFPLAPDVYSALREVPPEKVRVVILGQDPYPTPGQGHGLSFSVRPGVVIPASLRNIYKEYEADLGVKPPRHGYLLAWAHQGVLLLNTVLTVRAGTPKSHAKRGWEQFTDAAIRAVNALPQPVVFLLWGADAKGKAKLIDAARHAVITGVHPSPLSASNGFFGSKPFSAINAALVERGREPIDWALPASVDE